MNAASHNNASWYTDTDGFLTHSPCAGSLYYKGPILQKIIQFFGDPPSYDLTLILSLAILNFFQFVHKAITILEFWA